MRRREFLKYSAATAVSAPFVRAASADAGTVKVGVVGAKTGPLAPGASVTHFPPHQLWADRTQPPEAVKAVERLASVDKADWISGVYATGFNLATAPTFAKYGYPQLAVACVTDQGPALVKRYPNFFVFLQSTTAPVIKAANAAIADYLRKNKFNTIVGEVSMPGQIIDKNYTVGQWQGGFFQAVAGVGFSDFAQVKLKTGWA
jgi:hypothetical protein